MTHSLSTFTATDYNGAQLFEGLKTSLKWSDKISLKAVRSSPIDSELTNFSDTAANDGQVSTVLAKDYFNWSHKFSYKINHKKTFFIIGP